MADIAGPIYIGRADGPMEKWGSEFRLSEDHLKEVFGKCMKEREWGEWEEKKEKRFIDDWLKDSGSKLEDLPKPSAQAVQEGFLFILARMEERVAKIEQDKVKLEVDNSQLSALVAALTARISALESAQQPFQAVPGQPWIYTAPVTYPTTTTTTTIPVTQTVWLGQNAQAMGGQLSSLGQAVGQGLCSGPGTSAGLLGLLPGSI